MPTAIFAQCPCSGDDGGSGIHPLIVLAFLVGLWLALRWAGQIWKKKGISTMNKIGKISIVVVLLAAVGVVIALKRDGSTPAGQTDKAGAPEAGTSRPAAALPRLVDLGADTCIPCKMMAPILEELKAEYAGRLQVEFYDVCKNPGIGEKFGIRIIPTQIFYDASGRELYRHEGFMSRADILAKWKELGINVAAEVKQRPE